ncbi:MAG TPA: HAD family hydrolase [Bacillaceae bacterium]
MSDFKVLFLDIDGTILKPDHTYEPSTKDAILQVQEQGVEVFLATGRPLHEIADLAEELNVTSFIGYNGALAVYQERTVVNEPMSERTVGRFVRIAREHGHAMVMYTSEKNYYTDMDAAIVQEFIQAFELKKNERFTPEVMPHILGATLINLKDADVSLYEGEEHYHFSQVNVEGLKHCYDVIRDNVNKGRAIQTLLDLMGIPKEKAIAFGDGMNDKEMLSSVGHGFAMGNAHPDLLAYTPHRTTAVDDSGIYNGLKSLGLVR